MVAVRNQKWKKLIGVVLETHCDVIEQCLKTITNQSKKNVTQLLETLDVFGKIIIHISDIVLQEAAIHGIYVNFDSLSKDDRKIVGRVVKVYRSGLDAYHFFTGQTFYKLHELCVENGSCFRFELFEWYSCFAKLCAVVEDPNLSSAIPRDHFNDLLVDKDGLHGSIRTFMSDENEGVVAELIKRLQPYYSSLDHRPPLTSVERNTGKSIDLSNENTDASTDRGNSGEKPDALESSGIKKENPRNGGRKKGSINSITSYGYKTIIKDRSSEVEVVISTSKSRDPEKNDEGQQIKFLNCPFCNNYVTKVLKADHGKYRYTPHATKSWCVDITVQKGKNTSKRRKKEVDKKKRKSYVEEAGTSKRSYVRTMRHHMMACAREKNKKRKDHPGYVNFYGYPREGGNKQT